MRSSEHPSCLSPSCEQVEFRFRFSNVGSDASGAIHATIRKCANLSWKLKRLQTLWFDGIGRNNIKPVRERSRDEESVTFGEKTQEEASTG